ncbi:unnamed protein product [Prunus armeniaca]
MEAGKVVSLIVVDPRERERERERTDEKRETTPTTMEHEGVRGTQRMNDGGVDFVADVGGCGLEQRYGREDLLSKAHWVGKYLPSIPVPGKFFSMQRLVDLTTLRATPPIYPWPWQGGS